MDVDKLLAQVCGEARALGIPLAADILPQVRLNFRAVARFGCCVKTREGHIIEVSARLSAAGERAVR